MTEPRIYVASLSDFNAGTLLGRWIDATQDAGDIHAEVTEMLATSTEGMAEEWAIHDYEGFEGIKLSEYESFETVSTLANLIKEHGEAVAAFYNDDPGSDVSDLGDRFTEAYRGEWASLEEYADQLLEDVGTFDNVPDMLRTYFDVEKFARDLELGGDVWTHTGMDYRVHVFDNNV